MSCDLNYLLLLSWRWCLTSPSLHHFRSSPPTVVLSLGCFCLLHCTSLSDYKLLFFFVSIYYFLFLVIYLTSLFSHQIHIPNRFGSTASKSHQWRLIYSPPPRSSPIIIPPSLRVRPETWHPIYLSIDLFSFSCFIPFSLSNFFIHIYLYSTIFLSHNYPLSDFTDQHLVTAYLIYALHAGRIHPILSTVQIGD
jgi:hypothetical protein